MEEWDEGEEWDGEGEESEEEEEEMMEEDERQHNRLITKTKRLTRDTLQMIAECGEDVKDFPNLQDSIFHFQDYLDERKG